MKKRLLISLISLCLNLSAAEFGFLNFSSESGPYGPADTKESDLISLNEGDIFEVVGFSVIPVVSGEDYAYAASFLIAENSDGNIVYKKPFASGGGYNYPISNGQTLAGPCTIYLYTTYTGYVKNIYLSYKLTRASEVEYKQANIVSLPADTVGAGTHEIVVEASDDLQTWTPVHSSSIGGNKAFFRTRVVTNGE